MREFEKIVSLFVILIYCQLFICVPASLFYNLICSLVKAGNRKGPLLINVN